MDANTERKSQVARAIGEDPTIVEMRLRLSELDHKLASLLLADRYHRMLHIAEITLLLLILFR